MIFFLDELFGFEITQIGMPIPKKHNYLILALAACDFKKILNETLPRNSVS